MDTEKVILFQIYQNSSFGNNEFSLSEFSEKFINQEIKNSFSSSISKLKFANAVEELEKKEILKKSSRHHLTTLNSWRLTKKSKQFFQILLEKNITDFESFKSEYNLRQ
tara:strand:+ start:190 stop:516 length:327 start_codon:yes stop_codon:yes gene_type:complete